MKNLTCMCVGAVFLCLEAFSSVSFAAAQDPPPLEAPASTAPGPDRPGTPDPRSLILRDGPPRELPADPAGPAPGPDFFFVPGQYVPSSAGVAWRPGFWARVQPGWEWVPARWVRLSEGWTYREGHWERAESATATATELPRRRVVARPPLGPFSPDAASAAAEPVDPNSSTELVPLPDNGAAAPPPGVQQPAPRLPGSGGSEPESCPEAGAAPGSPGPADHRAELPGRSHSDRPAGSLGGLWWRGLSPGRCSAG